jgi:hypothetical protein
VIVIVEVETPLAVTGPVPVMVELRALAPTGVKTTVAPDLTTGETIPRTLLSAVRDFKLQVDTPKIFEAEHAP